MIDKVRRAAEWVGDLAEKAKAVAGAVGTFTAVVVAATADDVLGLDEIPTLVTAALTLGVTVYYIIWRTPNAGHINPAQLTEREREAIYSVLGRRENGAQS